MGKGELVPYLYRLFGQFEPPGMPVRILIYEDNTDFREALVQLVNSGSDHVCVGAFHNCSQVLRQLGELGPDVILMDIEMPDSDGLEGLQQIRSADGEVKVIMLTVFDDNIHVLDAICKGASGYILKKHAFKKLFTSIDEVLEGGAPLSANIAKMILGHIHKSSSPAEPEFDLTVREKEILNLLVKGNSFKIIAAQLFVGLETVKTHIKNIYLKLQVHTQTEAVAKAIRNRIVK
jgi:DNA-binding NarL/FixJ family response regulator